MFSEMAEQWVGEEKKRLITIVQKWRDKKHVGDMNPINILDDIIKEMRQ